jgi:hypothetical protein
MRLWSKRCRKRREKKNKHSQRGADRRSNRTGSTSSSADGEKKNGRHAALVVARQKVCQKGKINNNYDKKNINYIYQDPFFWGFCNHSE